MGLPLIPDLTLLVIYIQSLKIFFKKMISALPQWQNILSYAVTYFELNQPSTNTIDFLPLNTYYTNELQLNTAPGLHRFYKWLHLIHVLSSVFRLYKKDLH